MEAGVSAGVIQEIDEEIQRGMVGLFFSFDGDGDGVHGVRAGSEEHRSPHLNAHSICPFCAGFASSVAVHCTQYHFASSRRPRRRP